MTITAQKDTRETKITTVEEVLLQRNTSEMFEFSHRFANLGSNSNTSLHDFQWHYSIWPLFISFM